MEGNSKEVAVSTTKERVVELVADVRDIIVPVSSEEKIILNFSLSGVTSRTEGNVYICRVLWKTAESLPLWMAGC